MKPTYEELEQRVAALTRENAARGELQTELAREIQRLEQRVAGLKSALACAAAPLEILKATECDDAAIALNPALKRMIVTAVDAARAALTPPAPETHHDMGGKIWEPGDVGDEAGP